MFDNLSERLSKTIKNLRGQGRLTEDNISEALRDVRMALLEADVALPVVKSFIDRTRERALGQEVLKNLSPGQALIKVVRDELQQVMGDTNETLDLNVQPPAVILMAGLQGSGKTTFTGLPLLISSRRSAKKWMPYFSRAAQIRIRWRLLQTRSTMRVNSISMW
jgi:signal recognition particle subunit SRP54